jgi:hypothetical protein
MMVARRSALALVVVCSAVLCPTLGSRVSRSSTTKDDAFTSAQAAPLSFPFFLSVRSQPRNVSQFGQFRYRMKSVLGETTDPSADHSDLGPAVIPSCHVSVSPRELSSRRPPTVHPLRC